MPERMRIERPSRRVFLAQSATALAATAVSYGGAPVCLAADREATQKNDRPTFALIGAGWQPDTKRTGRGIQIGGQAKSFADLAVICEVDSIAGEFAKARLGDESTELIDDYRRVLERKDIDAVLIATPDHWHTKIAMEAMRAGKDVYCEKPATVTIDEGKRMRAAVKETGRVLQIGTQQRSEYNGRFLKAVAMVRDGRVGQLQRIQIGLGPGWEGGPFAPQRVPETLDWERWVGPAPMMEYWAERTHRTFRWWYEYAGGQLADWGAHHIDIAQWALGQEGGGPLWIEGSARMNQPLVDGMPTREDTYNTPIEFSVRCRFAANPDIVPSSTDGVEVLIDSGRNGITFEGDQGRLFVNRGTLEGVPVDRLRDDPLPEDAISRLTGLAKPVTHMQNFFDCVKSRSEPVATIAKHHRTLTTCHLANLSLRLNRRLQWDAKQEHVVSDDVANALMKRTERAGYEIDG